MSEFKGTKGPWISDVRSGCVAVYQDDRQEDTQGCHRDDERNIAYSNKGAEYDEVAGFWVMDKRTIHDFNLIAAAPELFNLVKTANGKNGCHTVAWQKKAKEALAKALGQ